MSIVPPGAPDWTPRAAAPKDGYVLFFSTLEPRKNVAGLLDAWERLLGSPESLALREGARGFQPSGRLPELILAGRATDDARPWLDRIGRSPLRGAVRHIGYVDAGDRRALYDGARLLVQPSFDEGFGIPVLEAMSAGVPVVAASRGSLPEVLDGAGLLVDPEDPADIASGIKRVLDDEALAAACTAKGVQRARAFRWEETAHRVYDTYRLAIERARATHRA
jgi:glycosyltransferase involved in cell wall biosynthesis